MIVVNAFIEKNVSRNGCTAWHRRSQGRTAKGPCPPKFLENIVILCFERCFSKRNSVIRLKSNILATKNFRAGYATAAWQ